MQVGRSGAGPRRDGVNGSQDVDKGAGRELARNLTGAGDCGIIIPKEEVK